MFNYTSATESEMFDFVLTTPSQTVSMARAYHMKHRHSSIVGKIDVARKQAKMLRLKTKLTNLLKEEDYGYSND